MILAGYTALIISFRIVDTPEEVFFGAINRVQEIGLGVICAALVSRLVFPIHAGPILFDRVTAWLDNAANLAVDTLSGRGEDLAAMAERRRLAADAVEMRAFTTHVGYDTSHHRELVGLAHVLQQRMVALLPIFSAIHDQIEGLERIGAKATELRGLVTRTAQWLAPTRSVDIQEGQRILRALRQIEARPRQDWDDLLRGTLTEHLIELVDNWLDCAALKSAIEGTAHDQKRVRRLLQTTRPYRIQRDYLTAATAAFAASATVLLFAAFWITTGWSYGASGMQVAGVFCCIMATIDNPVPALRKFLVCMLWAAAAGFVYNYGVFPHFTQFSSIAAALGLFLIPAGVLMARRETMLVGLTLCVNLPYNLTLSSRLDLDFQSYIEANISVILAMICAILCTQFLRSIGAETSGHRVLRQAWRQISTIATSVRPAPRQTLIQMLTDAFGFAAPKLANIPIRSGKLATDLIRDLRVALNVLSLRNARTDLHADAHIALDEVLALTATYYTDRARGRNGDNTALLAAVDRCLASPTPSVSISLSHSIRTNLSELRLAIAPKALPPVQFQVPKDNLT